jgi:hypothetical protein
VAASPAVLSDGNARLRSYHRIWQITLKGVGPRPALGSDTDLVDPFERRRLADGRLVTRREALAQAVTERAVELVMSALDVNALLDWVDLNAVLDRIDLDRLVGRMDLNDIVQRLDVDALVEQTDLGAVIAASSAGSRAICSTCSAARPSGWMSSSPAG